MRRAVRRAPQPLALVRERDELAAVKRALRKRDHAVAATPSAATVSCVPHTHTHTPLPFLSRLSSLSAAPTQIGLILSTPSKRLLEIKGISDAKLEKITEAAKKLKPTGFLSGTEALVQAKVRGAGGKVMRRWGVLHAAAAAAANNSPRAVCAVWEARCACVCRDCSCSA